MLQNQNTILTIFDIRNSSNQQDSTNRFSYHLNQQRLKQVVHFFRNASGCKDPLALVEEFTDDIDHFLDLLAKLHSHFKDKGMKQRCTIVINVISPGTHSLQYE
jgi:hypothetical protein